ncbi:hypothetical protein NQ314_016014 [Rhamnusium bicolor]|uniref:Retrotransposon gag domain-containing protein n=1 Tax=Rhamnusium bicolor TaxID=1586634 RepID=A0AAV8WXE8_9CUCU|nr:hypothetical protein NQ314_016014 [Rhamnusium bicolor]
MAGAGQKSYEFNADVDMWDIYVERLEQHLTANKIGEESIKVAVLLSSVGQSTYKLLRDLSFPDPLKNKTYEQLCELLKCQFGVHVSVWRERKKFYEIRQTDETVAEWYAKVRSHAVSCKFGADLSKILKDKLASGKILDRMCEEEVDKPIEELLSLALKTENQASIRYVASSNFAPTSRGDGKLTQRYQHGRRSVVTRTGHGSQPQHEKRKYPRIKDGNSNDNFKVDIEINGKRFKFILDSGSSISVCSKEMYLKDFSNCRRRRDNILLRGYNGETFTPEGYFVTKVTLMNQAMDIKFYVIANGGPGLLGRDWMTKFNRHSMQTNVEESDGDLQTTRRVVIVKVRIIYLNFILQNLILTILLTYRPPVVPPGPPLIITWLVIDNTENVDKGANTSDICDQNPFQELGNCTRKKTSRRSKSCISPCCGEVTIRRSNRVVRRPVKLRDYIIDEDTESIE